MSLTPYPTLRLKLTMPQALKLQFLPAIPGSNATASAAAAQAAADAATAAANTAVAATANKVDKSGDVMTGFLTLNADPNTNLQAATKHYVDIKVSAGGIPEAPSDGNLYGRMNAAWAQAQPFDADLTSLAGASATNQWYYRSAANTWSPVTVGATMTFVGGVLNTTAGGGNVIATGMPTIGQWARWTGAATIEGVDAANTGFQLLDADLTSIASATVTNQWLYRSAADTWTPVTIGANLTFTGGTLAATGGGGGNVSNSGTPTVGQYGKWVTATTIQGVAPATVLTDIGAAPVGAEYITSTTDVTLTSERVLTDTATVTWDRTTAGQIKANAAGGGGAATSISDTPPGSPTNGQLWWESDTGTLFIYYTDANSSQWVAVGGSGSGSKLGVIDGSAAAAGEIGECLEQTRAFGSPLTLSNGVNVNVIASPLALTAGDWDISANVTVTITGSTAITSVAITMSTVSATFNSSAGFRTDITVPNTGSFAGCTLPPVRVSLTGNQNYYLVVSASFVASSVTCYGIIHARRVR